MCYETVWHFWQFLLFLWQIWQVWQLEYLGLLFKTFDKTNTTDIYTYGVSIVYSLYLDCNTYALITYLRDKIDTH